MLLFYAKRVKKDNPSINPQKNKHYEKTAGR